VVTSSPMKTRVLDDGPPRVVLVVAAAGDEWSEFTQWAREARLGASTLSGIGGFSEATLGYFDVETKKYVDIPVGRQVEVLALTGDVTLDDGEPFVHAHVICGARDGSVIGGHIQRATINPTLELTVTETPKLLTRRFDPAAGLALIDL
jgi:uncharacterized protein